MEIDFLYVIDFLNDEWEQDRQTITHGLEAFYEAGKALQRVKEHRSYEAAGYGSFAAAIKAEWGMSPRHANRLISSAETVGNLLEDPSGEKGPIGPDSPTHETQVRPINDLTDDPELQQTIWNAAVDTAPDSGVTEEHVRQVRDLVILDETKGGTSYSAAKRSHPGQP